MWGFKVCLKVKDCSAKRDHLNEEKIKIIINLLCQQNDTENCTNGLSWIEGVLGTPSFKRSIKFSIDVRNDGMKQWQRSIMKVRKVGSQVFHR